MNFSPDKMPEAEVSLRLAFGLIGSGKVVGDIEVALDGAQIQIKRTVHFRIVEFMAHCGWHLETSEHPWHGTWSKESVPCHIEVHSTAGSGDVVANLRCGRTFRVEAKKGALTRYASSAEYPLIREGLGQLLTVETASDSDVLAVAVPSSPKFEQLTRAWRDRPLMKKTGIAIATVDRENTIRGLEHVDI